MEKSQMPVRLFLGMCIFSLRWTVTQQQVNVALGGRAAQSSFWSNYYYANFAIDGNREPNFGLDSCSCTDYELSPWWRVDLLRVHDISNVIITNRGDCCSNRIDGAEIHIGNSLINNGNNNPRCVTIPSIPAGTSANYTCNMRGRYVNLVIPGVYQLLTLCEVEVYGVPVPVIKKTFLRIKLNSSEDLTNPIMRDKVLQKMRSAIVKSPISQLNWTNEPELETET